MPSISNLPPIVDAGSIMQAGVGTPEASGKLLASAMDYAVQALDTIGVDSELRDTFLGAASFAKPGAGSLGALYGLSRAVKGYGAEVHGAWRANDLMGIAGHGLTSLANLDQVIALAVGEGYGLAALSNMGGGVVNLSGLAKGMYTGNVTQIAFSGAKLAVNVALSGNGVAMGALTVGELAYKWYYGSGAAPQPQEPSKA
jgi:hypothetical protein